VRLAQLLVALLHHAQARDGELQLHLELGLDVVSDGVTGVVGNVMAGYSSCCVEGYVLDVLLRRPMEPWLGT
jgi:hypothetical protein